MARNHLVERRKELGLTQKKVAELSGLTSSTVSSIEKGYRDIRPDEAVALASALAIHAAAVLGQNMNLTITDSTRLDAMINNKWRIETNGALHRIKSITPWLDSPRAAIDAAINKLIIPDYTKSTRVYRPNPQSGFIWKRWEPYIFPAETNMNEMIKSARAQGWRISVNRLRKSREWRAMAMEPIRTTETALCSDLQQISSEPHASQVDPDGSRGPSC